MNYYSSTILVSVISLWAFFTFLCFIRPMPGGFPSGLSSPSSASSDQGRGDFPLGFLHLPLLHQTKAGGISLWAFFTFLCFIRPRPGFPCISTHDCIVFCLFGWVFVCVGVSMTDMLRLSVCLSVRLSLPVCLPVCASVRLCLCVSVHARLCQYCYAHRYNCGCALRGVRRVPQVSLAIFFLGCFDRCQPMPLLPGLTTSKCVCNHRLHLLPWQAPVTVEITCLWVLGEYRHRMPCAWIA